MRFISWNVNGLRAAIGKGFIDAFEDFDVDFLCLQETKLKPGQGVFEFPGYLSFWNHADKSGYSGTCIFTKHKPLNVANGIGNPLFDTEGRVITLEYAGFYLVNVYVPMSQNDLGRLQFRLQFDDAFRQYICGLKEHKPVIVCGDFNVVHDDLDFESSLYNRFTPGLTEYERKKMSELLDAGFVDTWRLLHPQEPGYTAALGLYDEAGMRLDYILVSDDIVGRAGRVQSVDIDGQSYGSDHCFIEIELEV